MTASELKKQVETARPDSKFFSRENMRAFGDTMRNYGVRSATVVTNLGETVECWELWRKRPVKEGLKGAAYFDKQSFRQVFPKRQEV